MRGNGVERDDAEEDGMRVAVGGNAEKGNASVWSKTFGEITTLRLLHPATKDSVKCGGEKTERTVAKVREF
jgi:hypothetical protein